MIISLLPLSVNKGHKGYRIHNSDAPRGCTLGSLNVFLFYQKLAINYNY